MHLSCTWLVVPPFVGYRVSSGAPIGGTRPGPGFGQLSGKPWLWACVGVRTSLDYGAFGSQVWLPVSQAQHAATWAAPLVTLAWQVWGV